MSFKVIRSRFPADIETQLNKLSEKWNPVEPLCMSYDSTTNQYAVIVRVGIETVQCTTLGSYLEQEIKLKQRLDK